MKDYKITKIWANTISDISEDIDSRITYLKDKIQSEKLDIANKEPDHTTDWMFENIEESEEKLKAYEWALNLINAPFKIKK